MVPGHHLGKTRNGCLSADDRTSAPEVVRYRCGRRPRSEVLSIGGITTPVANKALRIQCLSMCPLVQKSLFGLERRHEWSCWRLPAYSRRRVLADPADGEGHGGGLVLKVIPPAIMISHGARPFLTSMSIAWTCSRGVQSLTLLMLKVASLGAPSFGNMMGPVVSLPIELDRNVPPFVGEAPALNGYNHRGADFDRVIPLAIGRPSHSVSPRCRCGFILPPCLRY